MEKIITLCIIILLTSCSGVLYNGNENRNIDNENIIITFTDQWLEYLDSLDDI